MEKAECLPLLAWSQPAELWALQEAGSGESSWDSLWPCKHSDKSFLVGEVVAAGCNLSTSLG